MPFYDLLNKYRIVPRIMVSGYGYMLVQTSDWFMALPDPTGPQAAFISTIWGASAAFFGFYLNSGNRND